MQQPLHVRMYVCVCACVRVFNNALNPPAIIDINEKTNLVFYSRPSVSIGMKKGLKRKEGTNEGG